MARIPVDEETAPRGEPVDDVPFRDPAPGWDRYAIVERIGEGGMGVVYRAIDRRLQRTVAVKLLRSRDPQEIASFQRAARAQARLDHEHVCRVFEVGTVDGRAFLAMQFIKGRTLRDLAAELDLDEKLELMEQVARAVQAAHAAGVVHRDLKPGNVMVERRPDGSLHAVVLDFGIAHDTGAPDDAPTVPMGTPAFMAPEQIRADAATDHRIDVWGLGATLYAVLAEQVPFYGATRAETKARVLTEEPLRLGLLVPGTSEDLETIVAVAMAKDPARRYPSARAFADDVRRWLDGEPIRTRRGDPFYRLSTWVRTRRMLAAALALVLVTSAAAAGSALWLRVRESRRQVLVEHHQNVVEQIDRMLRRARMMPLHDTTAAETAARSRLAEVEESLRETGPLARGPAYYALGFGHLMLREFDAAEKWLQAAVDSGFVRPEVETALGVAEAMQILEGRSPVGAAGSPDADRIAEAVRHLRAGGPGTAERDDFHRALASLLEGRMEDALDLARRSAAELPWMYEATQLEGDILVAMGRSKATAGDLAGAAADLRRAGDVYARGLEVARSDAWMYQAEAERALRLAELPTGDGEPVRRGLADRAIKMAAAATVARPGRAEPLELEARGYAVKAAAIARAGGDAGHERDEASRLEHAAAELEQNRGKDGAAGAAAHDRFAESHGAASR